MSNSRADILLRKLIDGSISQEEQWELEKLSLDDAFLSEALEGYYNSTAEHEEKIFLLTKKFRKESTKKIQWVRWGGIAAALVIMLSSVFWFMNESNQSLENLSMNDAVQEKEIVEDLEQEEPVGDAANLEAVQDGIALEESPRSDPKVEKVVPKTPVPIKKKEQNNLSEGALSLEERAEEMVPIIQSIPQTDIKVIGRVENLEGKPLIGARLKSNQSQLTAFTDDRGAFEMSVKSNESLFVDYRGFADMTVAAEPELNIQLEEVQEKFSARARSLAEQMNEPERSDYYSNKLDQYFEEELFECSQILRNKSSFTLIISLDENGMVSNILNLDRLPESCFSILNNDLRELAFDGFFDAKNQTQFRYELKVKK